MLFLDLYAFCTLKKILKINKNWELVHDTATRGSLLKLWLFNTLKIDGPIQFLEIGLPSFCR
jgi:hypothetical protein